MCTVIGCVSCEDFCAYECVYCVGEKERSGETETEEKEASEHSADKE